MKEQAAIMDIAIGSALGEVYGAPQKRRSIGCAEEIRDGRHLSNGGMDEVAWRLPSDSLLCILLWEWDKY